MNSVERLKLAVRARFPGATIKEDRFPSGNVWLDIRAEGRIAVVEYKPPHGYGISTLHDKSGWEGYGEAADRMFSRYRDAEQHLLRMLRGTARQPGGSKAARPPVTPVRGVAVSTGR